MLILLLKAILLITIGFGIGHTIGIRDALRISKSKGV